jgi:hypothetical protein
MTHTEPLGEMALRKHALDHAPFAAAIFKVDEHLTLIWRNRTHARVSESGDLDVRGKPMFDAFPASDNSADSIDTIRASCARVCDACTTDKIGPFRFDLRNSKGVFVEHHWTMEHSPILGAKGRVVAILQTARDVTHEVLERRLSATWQRAAHTVAAVSHFSYDPRTGHVDRHAEVDALLGCDPEKVGHDIDLLLARVAEDDGKALRAGFRALAYSSDGAGL